MSDIVVVTSSQLCRGDFLKRIESIAAARPGAVILREKQLSEGEYFRLAQRVKDILLPSGIKLICHNFVDAAIRLKVKSIHLPLAVLKNTPREKLLFFEEIGASCHSIEDIAEAKAAGCTYATIGNIFETDCKKGLKGRGTDFLERCCRQNILPLWAIGGITAENIASVRAAGAQCCCIMSAFMRCDDPKILLSSLERGK